MRRQSRLLADSASSLSAIECPLPLHTCLAVRAEQVLSGSLRTKTVGRKAMIGALILRAVIQTHIAIGRRRSIAVIGQIRL